MHECHQCGQACGCDDDDTWDDGVFECFHECARDDDWDGYMEDDGPLESDCCARCGVLLGPDDDDVCKECERLYRPTDRCTTGRP